MSTCDLLFRDLDRSCVVGINWVPIECLLINRAFKYKTKEVVLKLYKSLVRPHIDKSNRVFTAEAKLFVR